ncbi:MAG: AbrB/MazE/SpoVT family DNA-binding domain-containing protein [Candidatus Thermoplasmatota archaeon]|nr:AbrB/MazE/SpoVT family DNA-binding domain-containing protein [Candidatus Thermoplasmatota archaeon]
MEMRKLQKTGGSTYIVSLPKHWILSSKLKQGDSVSMIIDENGLLTLDPAPGSRRLSSRVEVYVEDDDESQHMLRRLIGLYISGHDEIVLRSRTRIPAEIRKVVRDFTRKVIGPEIVEESSNVISIQDVADHSHLDMKKILRRMHLMSRSMHIDAMDSMLSGNTELAGDVVSRDDEVDRLYWFVSKQQSMVLRDLATARKMGLTVAEASFYLSASKALERIADHAARIAHSAASLPAEKLPDKLVKGLQSYSTAVIAALDQSVEALMKGDMDGANVVADESERIRESGEALIQQIMDHRGKFVVPLARVVESLERSGLYSADIAEIAINLGGAPKK